MGGVEAADFEEGIAVIGGGAAGFELALAAAKRLRSEAQARGDDPAEYAFSLIAGGTLLRGLAPGAQRAARKALARSCRSSAVRKPPMLSDLP